MKFQCFLCNSIYEVLADQQGEQIDCPTCKKKILVPRQRYDKGRVIGGDFVIEHTLGSGGMGTVYLARQVSLNREVALKVLARQFTTDDKFRQDFSREARSVSRLTHSNIVQTYSFGEDEDELYLAMEYVKGLTLGDRITSENRLIVDEALNITQQMAEGLHTAWEEEQLIHRDLKPDNIMVMRDGHAKLTDMGLARKKVELENVTEVSGTPSYMNPEQFLKLPMDCRADIYSLGVVLYHAIVGQLPFVAKSVKEMARQHIQDDVEFPDKKVDVPSEVKKLLRKMMAKDPDDRFKNYEELLQRIYKIRGKLSGSSDLIPNVHTRSFNRYEFREARPERLKNEKSLMTQRLSRQEIRPLNEVVRGVTGGMKTRLPFRQKRESFGVQNLATLVVLTFTILLALLWPKSEPQSDYAIDVSSYLKEEKGLVAFQEELEKIKFFLDQFPEEDRTLADLEAKAALLALRSELQMAESARVETEFQEQRKDAESLEAEYRAELKKLAKELHFLTRQSSSLQKALNAKQAEDGELELKNEVGALEKAIFSESHQMLQRLWEKEQSRICRLVLLSAKNLRFSSAEKILVSERQAFSGSYLQWFDRQIGLCQKATKLYTAIFEALPSAEDLSFVVDELEYEVEEFENGKIYFVDSEKGLSVRELSKPVLWALVRELILEKKIADPAADELYGFALLSSDFTHALEYASLETEELKFYCQSYLERGLRRIRSLQKKSSFSEAETLSRELYRECSPILGAEFVAKELGVSDGLKDSE